MKRRRPGGPIEAAGRSSAAASDPGPNACGEILLALLLGGRLSERELGERLGGSAGEHSCALGGLCRNGAVERGATPDGVARFRLTSDGRHRAAEILSRERAELAGRLAPLLAGFDASNRALKALVQRWQVRSIGTAQVVNDHSDAAYDERILRDLGALLGAAGPWLERLAPLRPRYRRYRERLAVALDRAGRGEHDYVAGLRVDSVHAIWWQMHGDLLAVLGRARTAADA